MADKTSLQVSVASLAPVDKEGWCTKQGGSIKTWKRRWFVLKDKRLWYFKGKNENEAQGFIELDSGSTVKDESGPKHKCMFSIQARGAKGRRVFPIKPDTLPEVQEWIEAIKKNISGTGGNAPAKEVVTTNAPASSTPASSTSSEPAPAPAAEAQPAPAAQPNIQYPPDSARGKLASAKTAIPFLQDPDSKVLEFWQIWTDSIPPKTELVTGQTMEFHLAVSGEIEKLTWRTAGPQNIFIQRMVDFFWNVGAPESEIDRLNDVGALINPVRIGSWIDMSGKGGMDGGWYFPVDIPIKLAIEAADAGEPTKKVVEWSEKHNIQQVFSVGRDMGAAPPRQTEIRLKVPGDDLNAQLTIVNDAFLSFGFPALSEAALGTIKSTPPEQPLSLSIITSSEGFVRMGVFYPNPPTDVLNPLLEQFGGKIDGIQKLQSALMGLTPSFVEIQYLMKGFGYSVYKEGFDVVVHWAVTPEETALN